MSKWILALESSSAYIFSIEAQAPYLTTIQHFDHPEGRLQDRALVSDKPGRTKSMVSSGKHGVSEQVRPAQEEGRKFLRRIVSFLETQYERHVFSELTLVAAAAMLGELRSLLPEKLMRCVVRELNKELPGWLGERKIADQLIEELQLSI